MHHSIQLLSERVFQHDYKSLILLIHCNNPVVIFNIGAVFLHDNISEKRIDAGGAISNPIIV